MPGTGQVVGTHPVPLTVLCPADRQTSIGPLQTWCLGGSGTGSQPGWGSERALEQMVGGVRGEPGGQDCAPGQGSTEGHPCLPAQGMAQLG